jgi:hypothetical protein
MCGVEVINLKSSNCTWVGTSDHHVWQKYTYTLCPTGARRRGPCDDVQRAEGQTYNDDGSIRMNACPVCAKLAVAVRERNEAKRLADERYATAYGAAFTDERYVRLKNHCSGVSALNNDRFTHLLLHPRAVVTEKVGKAVAKIKILRGDVAIVDGENITIGLEKVTTRNEGAGITANAQLRRCCVLFGLKWNFLWCKN